MARLAGAFTTSQPTHQTKYELCILHLFKIITRTSFHLQHIIFENKPAWNRCAGCHVSFTEIP